MQTVEPDGDLMLSEARKLMVTNDLDVALSAHANYHKFKATKSNVEGSPKALEVLEPVDTTRLVHSKYAEFAAMVQAKTDRSLETRAEIAGLEGRVEELVQQNEEMKSRHANDMNSVASQKKIEALRLNEKAEMCQSITAKFTVFQGSCLMKVQTLHNKIIDFDLLLEKTHVVGTPGAGFGACGEGFFRLSAFTIMRPARQVVRPVREDPPFPLRGDYTAAPHRRRDQDVPECRLDDPTRCPSGRVSRPNGPRRQLCYAPGTSKTTVSPDGSA